jgi:hypothetical protein
VAFGDVSELVGLGASASGVLDGIAVAVGAAEPVGADVVEGVGEAPHALRPSVSMAAAMKGVKGDITTKFLTR